MSCPEFGQSNQERSYHHKHDKPKKKDDDIVDVEFVDVTQLLIEEKVKCQHQYNHYCYGNMLLTVR